MKESERMKERPRENMYENIDLEFKEIYVSDIKKDVIAFANTQGGTIYIGIRKDGEVIGINSPDEVMLQVASAIRDSIKPDIMPYIQIKAIEKNEKPIIEVTVEVGDGRPYYLQEKGLKPSGVYVRRGSASQPLSDEGIRSMIIENSGTSYECCRSINQELSFEVLQQEMKKRDLDFGMSQMKTLHMLTSDNLYNNLALLLSDQCEHTIKFAVYQGSDKTIFRDRKEFSGSIIKQMNDVFETINIYNKTKASFEGLDRKDKRDYPLEAIREVLLNAIVHRDYSFSGSTLINLYDDRLEFVSLGGLVTGISMDAIFMGVSQSRNTNLASVFYRMRLIESYGTGIGKIKNLYKEEYKKPIFESATGVFRAIIPNCNEVPEQVSDYIAYHITKDPVIVETKKRSQVEAHKYLRNYTKEINKLKIIEYGKQNSSFTRKDIEELLELKTTSVFNLLKELCEEEKIRPVDKGKNSHYELIS